MRPTSPVLAKPEEAKPAPPGDQPTVAWSEEAIEAAETRSTNDMLQPIREGICGTPAPLLLRAVGTDPKVVISPPATLSCAMADVLGEWLNHHRLARDQETIQFDRGQDRERELVCRNRYGAADTPLSEYALANAFDVSEFVLANAERATILDDWPKILEPSTPPADRSSSGTSAGNTASKTADKTTGRATITV